MPDLYSSYLGIIFFLILTGCGLPVPEEVPIVTAGVLSSKNFMHPGMALAACIIGALLGDLVIYGVGYHWGHSLISRHPRFAKLLHAQEEAKLERLIRKHGLKVLFVSRFLVGIRAPVYLAAGTIRMPLRRFLLTDAICASSVVGVFFGLGYFFGDHIAGLIHKGEIAVTVIVCLVVVGILLLAGQRVRKYLAEAAANGNGAVVEEERSDESPPIQPPTKPRADSVTNGRD